MNSMNQSNRTEYQIENAIGDEQECQNIRIFTAKFEKW